MKNENIPDKILLEYQKSQDSAEHFNNMIWHLTSLLVGFSIIALYIYFKDFPNKDIITTKETLRHLILIAGTISTFYVSYLIESSNSKKILKYEICKTIEKRYDFIGQNLLTEGIPKSNNTWLVKTIKNLKINRLFVKVFGNEGGISILRPIISFILILYSLLIIVEMIGTKDYFIIFVGGFCIILAFIDLRYVKKDNTWIDEKLSKRLIAINWFEKGGKNVKKKITKK